MTQTDLSFQCSQANKAILHLIQRARRQEDLYEQRDKLVQLNTRSIRPVGFMSDICSLALLN